MSNNNKKMCNILCHKHGQKLQRGFTECQGNLGLMHLFNGKAVTFSEVDNFPLIMCSRCGMDASYYKCNGSVS